MSKDEWTKAFDAVDADKDGSVTQEEVMKHMRAHFATQRSARPGSADEKQPAAKPEAQPEKKETPKTEEPKNESAAGAGRPERRVGRGAFTGRGPVGANPQFVGRPPTPEAMFDRLDKNTDGKLTADEVPAQIWERLLGRVNEVTGDKDDVITKEEFLKIPAPGPGSFRGGPGRRENPSRPAGEAPAAETPAAEKP